MYPNVPSVRLFHVAEIEGNPIHPGTINTESTRERLSPTRITSSAFCSFFFYVDPFHPFPIQSPHSQLPESTSADAQSLFQARCFSKLR